MKKILLFTLFLFFSFNVYGANECSNTVNTSSYFEDKTNKQKEIYIKIILNIGEKYLDKADSKPDDLKIDYYFFLEKVISEANTVNKFQEDVMGLLGDYLECRKNLLSNAFLTDLAAKLEGNTPTGNDNDNDENDQTPPTDQNDQTPTTQEPDISNYNFTTGGNINVEEINKYFNDFETYRNGAKAFNISVLENLFASGIGNQEYPSYVSWYKENIFNDTKYWHRNSSNIAFVSQFITRGDQSGSKTDDKEIRALVIKIAAKIVDELMPNGYIDYPSDNNTFHANREKIDSWRNDIVDIKRDVSNSSINTIPMSMLRGALDSVADTLGTYSFYDGKYIDFIDYDKPFESQADEKFYGDASHKVFSVAPTEFQMCPGLFMYKTTSWDSNIYLHYSSSDITDGKDKLDYKGAFMYSCRPFRSGSTGNHSIGSSALWDRTRAFRLYTGFYGEGVGSNKDDFPVVATADNAKNFCRSKWYKKGKILKSKKGTPSYVINYTGNHNQVAMITGDVFKKTSNSSEVDLIEYVKCWNQTEGDDPDLGSLNLAEKGKYEYEKSKGTIVQNLYSSYYWKTIEHGPFPGSKNPSKICNKDNLGQIEDVGGGYKVECFEKEHKSSSN